MFLLKPPYPAQNPFHHYAQDTRLRVYTRPRSQRICHFCLHPSPHPSTSSRSIGWGWRQTLHSPSPSPSPQQPDIQHLARHSLQKNGEEKRVKKKGWSLHPQLTLDQDFTPKRWRGEGKNRKTLDSRAYAGKIRTKASPFERNRWS